MAESSQSSGVSGMSGSDRPVAVSLASKYAVPVTTTEYILKLPKLNNWFSLFTNIGVILGLVLVAYELQQTQVSISS